MVKISGWKSKTLGTLIDEGKIVIQTGPFGTVLSAKEFVKYGIPVVAVREIREGYIQIFDETPCVSMETYNRLSKYNLATNDLVFARKGNVERSALIPLTKTKYFLGSDGICLRVITKNLLPQYLFYAIQSNTVRSFLIQNGHHFVRVVCLIFSVFHEKIILQNSEKSQCFQWVSGNFPVQTAVNPVTGRWAFGCSICSPSMSQRYCCGVSVFTSDSERGH